MTTMTFPRRKPEAGVTIETATLADREWAAETMAGSEPWITLGRGLEACRRVCLNFDYEVFVAKRGGQPLGFALTHRRGVVGSPYLATLAVGAPHRGLGIGTRLLQFVEDHFRPDAKHLFICVSSFNPRARQLYERVGYSPVGEIPDYFIDGESELLMHKRLR
jgi:ribosomal protein S18 acetylase RimI-like enzyme